MGRTVIPRLGTIKGLDGSPFLLPVDSEHKATVFQPWRFKGAHMVAFHISWISFFTSFVSTFAPAALIPIIREDLDLNGQDLGQAGIAAIVGTIISRIGMGVLCDNFGPRMGHATVMLGTAPAVFLTGLTTGRTGFIACRLVVGFSLGAFVACQFWSSVMFNVNIVGVANATGSGWGNLGGGVTQFLMPVIFTGISQFQPDFVAWRLAFILPGVMHIVVGVLVLVAGQDLPDGNFCDLQRVGELNRPQSAKTVVVAMKNYRTWLLFVAYGCCFGVELTMENIIVGYMFDHFNLSLNTAGALGATFGLVNIFARSLGGVLSDRSSQSFGFRGRLWTLWMLETLEGLLCIVLGLVHDSLAVTVLMMIIFSIAVQAAEGATYAIVPFVSKRALGVVSGLVSVGGSVGSLVTMSIYFRNDSQDIHKGIHQMGFLIIAVGLLVMFIYFPMWGSMFRGPKPGITEEDYYYSEYTWEEIAAGQAKPSVRFTDECKAQRGTHVTHVTASSEIQLTLR
ncbi:hypothetical protein BSKO_11612 [Bryopsis sp. KO-2023]|nr:hypothetical protein BSKO_11612 [Bryopsis sp. KO-2023]